jgi:hypothetical protein
MEVDGCRSNKKNKMKKLYLTLLVFLVLFHDEYQKALKMMMWSEI